MAYTLELTDGSSTYTFQVQPLYKPRFDYELDEGRTPPTVVAEIETWLLRGAVFMSASQAAITDDVETLRALIGKRASITSAKFKRDAAIVRELSLATHKGGVFVREFDPSDSESGLWATHWRGNLVVFGRRLFADGDGIVKLSKEVAYTYDSSGLATVTQRATLTTIPGTSAEAKARAQALASPGAAFGHQTAGPSDEPNVAVLDPEDTSASFESTWREHGLSLPAGVNEYSLSVETVDTPEGEIVTTTVRAKGPTSNQLKTAVRARKPATALGGAQEVEDKAGLEWAATYVQRRPSAASANRTGSSRIVFRRYEYEVEGDWSDRQEDRDNLVDLVPGFEPHFTRLPRGVSTVVERVVARVRGTWEGFTDFGLDSRLRGKADFRYQPGRTRTTPPVLEEAGLTRDADLWRAEASYTFLSANVDLDAIVTDLKKGQ